MKTNRFPFFATQSSRNTIWILIALATFLTPELLQAEIRIRKIRDPIWEPSGAFITSLEVPDADEHALFSEIMGPSHLVLHHDPGLSYLPTERRDGPYGREFQEAIAAWGGMETDVFAASDVREPHRMFRGVTLVPSVDAPTGPSFHGDEVPVIPNSLFPITYSYVQETKDGSGNLIDSWDREISGLTEYGEVTDNDGNKLDYTGLNWNHIHLKSGAFWPDPNEPLNDIVGKYRGVFRLRDRENNGWNITYSYEARNPTGIVGDLDYNRSLDMDDLNILTRNVALGSTHPRLDMNEDEVVNVADVHKWVTEVNGTWIGDANLDGEFNSGDFVQVFQAGKYESDESALWSEGDWNADERFESTDFVVAFQDGGYEMGLRPAVAAVPEPSAGLLMISAGVFAIARRRRA